MIKVVVPALFGASNRLTGNATHAQVVAIKSSVDKANDRKGIQLKATSVLCSNETKMRPAQISELTDAKEAE
jgi:hypothetical protein